MIGGNNPKGTVDNNFHASISHRDRTRKTQNRARNLVKVNGFIDVLRQGRVNRCDCLNSTFCLRERILDILAFRATRLQSKQSRNGLQIVLHAVVNLADRRIFRHQFLFTTSNFRNVARQNDGSKTRTAFREGQSAHRNGRSVA